MDCRFSLLSKASTAFFELSKPVVKNASLLPPVFSWSIPLLLQSLQYMQKTFNLVVHRTNHRLLLYRSGENCLHLFPCSFLVACSTWRSVTCIFTGSVEVQHSAIQDGTATSSWSVRSQLSPATRTLLECWVQ